MESIKLLELLSYTIPAIVTGIIAFLFFKQHTKNEHARRSYELKKIRQKEALPTRLQAYERMSLFLERINPTRLLVRIKPNGTDKIIYQQQLIQAIESEFEHNLSQQIYLSESCWNAIIASKNGTNSIIRTAAANTSVEDAYKLQEHILQKLAETPPPSNVALSFIKDEVKHIY